MFSCRRALFGLKVSRDQTRAFIEAEIRPRPLEEDGEAVSKANEKDDVNKQPRQPREESTQMEELQIGDGFISTDRGHASFVEVMKRLRLSASNHRQNIARSVAPFLHRDGRNAGQWLAGLMGKICQIADHQYFGMIWNR